MPTPRAGNPPPPSAPSGLSLREATPHDAQVVADLLSELGYPSPVDVMAARLEAFVHSGEVAILASDATRAFGLVTIHTSYRFNKSLSSETAPCDGR